MSKTRAFQASHSDDKRTYRRQDGISFLQLLLSAFLELYCTKQPGALALLDCISEFRRRHKIREARSAARDAAWAKQNGPALVRLLTYAQAEALETFDDRHCAQRLDKCIANLMAGSALSRGRPRRSRA